MKLARSIPVALVLALAGGSAAAVPDKQPPAEVTPSEAHAWVTLFDAVVDAVVANRDDCSKMAGTLNAIIDANQPTIEMAREAKAKGKRLPKSVHRHILGNVRRMIASLDKCGRDAKVLGAFKRIDLGSRT